MHSEYPPNIDELTEGPEPKGWQRWSELAVAIAVIAVAITILWLAKDFRAPRSVRVSPRVFPQLIGIGMLLVGVWYVVDVIRNPNTLSAGEDSEDVDITADANWTTLLLVGLGLTAFALLVQPTGFAVAAATMFAICSTAMGAKNILVNLGIGLVLGLAVFLVFDTWLGVRLPEGWLGFILP
jgi:putative tricarboxylic transport membrane protein